MSSEMSGSDGFTSASSLAVIAGEIALKRIVSCGSPLNMTEPTLASTCLSIQASLS